MSAWLVKHLLEWEVAYMYTVIYIKNFYNTASFKNQKHFIWFIVMCDLDRKPLNYWIHYTGVPTIDAQEKCIWTSEWVCTAGQLYIILKSFNLSYDTSNVTI